MSDAPERMFDALGNLFKAIVDKPFPGRCDECNAEQMVEEIKTDVRIVNVIHEEICPEFRARIGRAGAN